MRVDPSMDRWKSNIYGIGSDRVAEAGGPALGQTHRQALVNRFSIRFGEAWRGPAVSFDRTLRSFAGPLIPANFFDASCLVGVCVAGLAGGLGFCYAVRARIGTKGETACPS
jgi:hypothetical protein